MSKHVQFTDGTTTSDNAIARYDATVNTFIQDSDVFINDSAYIHGGAANTDSLHLAANDATFNTQATGTIKQHNILEWSDNFTLGTRVSFFTIAESWMYKVGGVHTMPAGNILTDEVVRASHTINYSSALLLSTVSLFNASPLISATASGTDTGTDFRMFAAFHTYAPVLATAVNRTTTTLTGFFSGPTIGMGAGSHASATSTVTDIYGFVATGGNGAQSTVTNWTSFKASNPTNTGTITNVFGIDVAAMTSGATLNYGIRVAKATSAAINLSSTDGTAPGGLLFGTDTTLYRSAANVLATDDKLYVAGEVEIDGDLNHDGANIGFFGTAPVAQQTELTDELTTITFTAPGTPDYAVQDLTAGGFGFVTKDEGNSVLSVIANLQTRVNELETKLVAYGLLVDAD